MGDLPIVPDNHKFLAKFGSGTLRITNHQDCCRFFQLLLEHPLEFVLRRLRSDLLNPKFGSQKSALL